MVRMIKARKKQKKIFPKKIKLGLDATPTTSFFHFKDYFRTDCDRKDHSKIIKEYIKTNFSKYEQKHMLKCPEWKFTSKPFVSATIKWKQMGNEFPPEWDAKRLLKEYFNDLIDYGKKVKTILKPVVKKSVQDLLKQKTDETIALIENVIDQNDTEFSVYDELKKNNAATNTAKGIIDYYKPLQDELNLLTNKKAPKDLLEGYDHLTQKEIDDYKNLIDRIVNEAEQYLLGKKAVRKKKIKQPLSISNQVKNLKYLAESVEYRLTSIDPTKIVGSYTLFTFNVKTRVLTEYKTDEIDGIKVKGSTLLNINLDKSRSIRLRKPNEFLPIVQTKPITTINKEWKKLTTKTNKPNARINKDTILLRVMN